MSFTLVLGQAPKPVTLNWDSMHDMNVRLSEIVNSAILRFKLGF